MISRAFKSLHKRCFHGGVYLERGSGVQHSGSGKEHHGAGLIGQASLEGRDVLEIKHVPVYKRALRIQKTHISQVPLWCVYA
jgi:hypothetical protein